MLYVLLCFLFIMEVSFSLSLRKYKICLINTRKSSRSTRREKEVKAAVKTFTDLLKVKPKTRL